MSRYRKKFRFADAKYRNVDLTKHRKLIIDTINQAVPNKHPKVFKRNILKKWKSKKCFCASPKTTDKVYGYSAKHHSNADYKKK